MSEFSRQGEGERRFAESSAFDVPPKTQTVPVPPPPTSRNSPSPRQFSRIRFAVKLAALAGFTIAAIFATLIVTYRFINPPASALMLLQRAGGQPIEKQWVPLNRISPHLVRAVIMSEDAGFCRHHGVAWGELRDAISRANDGIARGGSTISMQTTKNLFLWPSKSYIRKAIEIPLTFAMEVAWPKSRMLEIYLNIVEWGPGVFGAEAASRYHFDKPASALTEREAALLAVSLPAPLIREPGRPSHLLSRMGETVRGRMRVATSHTSCILQKN